MVSISTDIAEGINREMTCICMSLAKFNSILQLGQLDFDQITFDTESQTQRLNYILTPNQQSRLSRSTNKGHLAVSNFNQKRYGRRTFFLAVPVLRNALPNDIKNATSITIFKNKLKIFLSTRVYSFYETL